MKKYVTKNPVNEIGKPKKDQRFDDCLILFKDPSPVGNNGNIFSDCDVELQIF